MGSFNNNSSNTNNKKMMKEETRRRNKKTGNKQDFSLNRHAAAALRPKTFTFG